MKNSKNISEATHSVINAGQQENALSAAGITPDAGYLNSSQNFEDYHSLTIPAVYRCVDVISDAVAQLPPELYMSDSRGNLICSKDHPLYWILCKQPNKRMNRFTFLKSLVTSTLLSGNGYAYILRDDQEEIQGLYYLSPDAVSVIYDPMDPLGEITYKVISIEEEIESKDMIHLKQFSLDGVCGVSPISYASRTMEIAELNEQQAYSYFTSGAHINGIIQAQTPLNDKQKKQIKESWNQSFKKGKSTIPVLESNLSYQSVSIDPVDAQLLKSRQFSVIDICRFFGVSPIKAFDYSKSKHGMVKASQLAFLTDTLTPFLEKIELELETKLFQPLPGQEVQIRFDTSVLLRTDVELMAEKHFTYFNMGVLSKNEIREDLHKAPVKRGYDHYNQMDTQNIIENGDI